jgi:hypothetical protein
MKRQVKVDMAELAIALDVSFPDIHHYLDLETGRVVMVTDEIRSDLEEIYDEIYDEAGNRVVSLEEHLQQRDSPDWEKEMLLEADQVEQGFGTRYVYIERDDPYRDYNDMERFIGSVEDQHLKERLWAAIQGRGAFRRFKDLLARHPDVEKGWFEFKDAQLRQEVAAWLEANEIEPV